MIALGHRPEKRFFSGSVLLLALGLIISGCATSPREKVNKIPSGTDISKTLQAPPEKGLKRKVAIARFSNETKHGSRFLLGGNDERIGKQAMDILSARLTSTGKFFMVERSDLSFIKEEQKSFNVKSGLVGADYLILGSVSEFGRKAVSDVGVFSRNKKQMAYAKVAVRLVDVRTGEIIFSEEGEGRATSQANTVFGVGARAGYDDSLNDKALSAAISKLVSNLIENLMDLPWESKIIAKQGDFYILAGGESQGIKKGDIFKVLAPGKTVKNPQTGLPITLPGKDIGQLKVVKLSGKNKDEVSVCQLIDGSLKGQKLTSLVVRAPQ